MGASSTLGKDLRFLSARKTAEEAWELPPSSAVAVPTELIGREPQLWSMAKDPTPQQSLAFLESGIAELVAHEVGHTLGLRHNFKGSKSISFEVAVRTTNITQHGLSASVMDYLATPLLSSKTRS